MIDWVPDVLITVVAFGGVLMGIFKMVEMLRFFLDLDYVPPDLRVKPRDPFLEDRGKYKKLLEVCDRQMCQVLLIDCREQVKALEHSDFPLLRDEWLVRLHLTLERYFSLL